MFSIYWSSKPWIRIGMQPKLLDPDQMNTDPKHGFACANHLHDRESSFENDFKWCFYDANIVNYCGIFNTPYLVNVISRWRYVTSVVFFQYALSSDVERTVVERIILYIGNNAKTSFNFCPYNNDDCIDWITAEISTVDTAVLWICKYFLYPCLRILNPDLQILILEAK